MPTKERTVWLRSFSTASTQGSKNEGQSSSSALVGVLCWRLACAMGIVYVVTEYGIEWTVCDGPSMMPTVLPKGEIVLMDRFTPRFWGLSGGDTIAQRKDFALQQQAEHLRRMHQQRVQTKERLLQAAEEEFGKGPHGSRKLPDDTGLSVDPTQTAAAKEYLKHLGEKQERETWHESRIPVDQLPTNGAWDRLYHQLSTGVSVGDVVVLQHPNRIGTVCKRVVGLPGDIITKPSSRLGAERLEDLLYGSDPSFVGETTTRWKRRQFQRRLLRSGTQVPDGHIWVEGDNPWNSTDSRSYGAVPASLIMGRVVCRLWPLRGDAMLSRGDRPSQNKNSPSLAFSGSLAIPVGWDGQRILQSSNPRSDEPDNSAP